jgi:hypothetical protein
VVRALAIIAVAASPAVLMRVVADLRAGGPVTDRAIALATLNTLYALTLGTAMRTIDRGEGTLAASLAYSLTVLGLSALVGAVLAAVLTIALRLLRPTSQDTVILALVAAAVAGTTPLGGSAPLAALLGGLRQVHPRPGCGRASWAPPPACSASDVRAGVGRGGARRLGRRQRRRAGADRRARRRQGGQPAADGLRHRHGAAPDAGWARPWCRCRRWRCC